LIGATLPVTIVNNRPVLAGVNTAIGGSRHRDDGAVDHGISGSL
jgi:hypothetical protein